MALACRHVSLNKKTEGWLRWIRLDLRCVRLSQSHPNKVRFAQTDSELVFTGLEA